MKLHLQYTRCCKPSQKNFTCYWQYKEHSISPNASHCSTFCWYICSHSLVPFPLSICESPTRNTFVKPSSFFTVQFTVSSNKLTMLAVTLCLMSGYHDQVHWYLCYSRHCLRPSYCPRTTYHAQITCLGSPYGFIIHISWWCFCPHTVIFAIAIHNTYSPIDIIGATPSVAEMLLDHAQIFARC